MANDHGRTLLRAMLGEYAAQPANEDPENAAADIAAIQEAHAILKNSTIDHSTILRGLAGVMEEKMRAHPDDLAVILSTVIVTMRETAALIDKAPR